MLFTIDIRFWVTSNICYFKQLYQSYIASHDSYVLLSNSMRDNVEGIKLTEDLFFHNMFYFPTFRFNLLSLLAWVHIIKFLVSFLFLFFSYIYLFLEPDITFIVLSISIFMKSIFFIFSSINNNTQLLILLFTPNTY